MKNLQVAIIAKDVDVNIINAIKEQFSKAEIIVVTPDRKVNITGVNFYHDSFFLEIDEVRLKLNTNRIGWYYQQLLKYMVVYNSKFENILIIDGDSIVKNIAATENCIFTTGKMAIKKYIHFNQSVFGFMGEELSYITNQMLFNKIIFHEMLSELEKSHCNNWVDVIIDKINNSSENMFSEYQLYGSYAVNKHKVNVCKMKVFRRMDCVNDNVIKALNKYDLIAYESHHKTGILRKFRAKLYYKLGFNLG